VQCSLLASSNQKQFLMKSYHILYNVSLEHKNSLELQSILVTSFCSLNFNSRHELHLCQKHYCVFRWQQLMLHHTSFQAIKPFPNTTDQQYFISSCDSLRELINIRTKNCAHILLCKLLRSY